jgi:hypothetical protein
MKRFITSLLSATFVLLAFSLVLYTSCNTKDDLPDPCRHMICENGGTCTRGICVCPAEYEGKFCELKKDPCKDLNCLNGGICKDGTCACPFGFLGKRCELRLADKFKGVWYGPRKCDGKKEDTSSIYILTTEDAFKVKITFPGYDTSNYVKGDLVQPGVINIPAQLFYLSYGVSGTIKLNGSTIDVDITTYDPRDKSTVRCLSTYKHQ